MKEPGPVWPQASIETEWQPVKQHPEDPSHYQALASFKRARTLLFHRKLSPQPKSNLLGSGKLGLSLDFDQIEFHASSFAGIWNVAGGS